MVKIKQELETAEQSGEEDAVARKEELLEELLEIVENIDNAKGERLNYSDYIRNIFNGDSYTSSIISSILAFCCLQRLWRRG